MNLRIGVTGGVFLALAVFGFATPPDQPGPDKEKNPIKALLDGIPADLRTKVRDNPVRCDRVNDWLKENANGKTIEVRVELQEALPERGDKGYIVHLALEGTKINVLDADWHVVLADHMMGRESTLPSRGGFAHFSLEGVKTADAEKLVDAKRAVIKGKVKEAKITRLNREVFRPESGATNSATLTVVLEEVLVDGNKWTPYRAAKGGGIGTGEANPFGKGKKGTGTKKDPQP
jgi:hypothetical protein